MVMVKEKILPVTKVKETLAQEACRVLGAIPENLWLTNFFGSNEAHCALGHWNIYRRREASDCGNGELSYTVYSFIGYGISSVNDGACPLYQQSTPKARVIALLDDMIEKGL